jgi:hypothetical protein
MKSIWKYPLLLQRDFKLELPGGAKLLLLAEQDGIPTAWFEVNSDNDREIRILHCHGTGHDLPSDDRVHIGSVCMSGGHFVWHYYESKTRSA